MEELKQFILDKRKEGKVVVMGLEGPMSMLVEDIIKQPTDGLLYDLNRLEETTLTFIDDPKWVNDFAVALVIRELKSNLDQLEADIAVYKKLDVAAGVITADLEAEMETMREALVWYGEKAEAMKRYAEAKPPLTVSMTAVVTELSLDGGKRAKVALEAGGEQEEKKYTLKEIKDKYFPDRDLESLREELDEWIGIEAGGK